MRVISTCLIALLTNVAPKFCFGGEIVNFKPGMLAESYAKAARADYPTSDDRSRPVPQSATFILHINPKNGEVESITIEKPAADRRFTALWMTALVTWKFKPQTVVNVRVPVMSIHGLRVGPARGPGLHNYVP